mmetsp:Transcript_30892/g.95584  ORF Transcript_30892/g.95584 Transcript_30892/m.95584 type:complete len:81 (+) Transcript_30892:2588-2830(+)
MIQVISQSITNLNLKKLPKLWRRQAVHKYHFRKKLMFGIIFRHYFPKQHQYFLQFMMICVDAESDHGHENLWHGLAIEHQ